MHYLHKVEENKLLIGTHYPHTAKTINISGYAYISFLYIFRLTTWDLVMPSIHTLCHMVTVTVIAVLFKQVMEQNREVSTCNYTLVIIISIITICIYMYVHVYGSHVIYADYLPLV